MKYPETLERINFNKVKVTGVAGSSLIVRLNPDTYARVSPSDHAVFYTLSGPANKSHRIPGLYEKLNK